MSARRCNLCLLADIRRRAEAMNQTAMTKNAPKDAFPDGIDVYVSRDGDSANETQWVAWFAKVPDTCAC
jgi:hypothetical protein